MHDSGVRHFVVLSFLGLSVEGLGLPIGSLVVSFWDCLIGF